MQAPGKLAMGKGPMRAESKLKDEGVEVDEEERHRSIGHAYLGEGQEDENEDGEQETEEDEVGQEEMMETYALLARIRCNGPWDVEVDGVELALEVGGFSGKESKRGREREEEKEEGQTNLSFYSCDAHRTFSHVGLGSRDQECMSNPPRRPRTHLYDRCGGRGRSSMLTFWWMW